jgi:hypothetical protein
MEEEYFDTSNVTQEEFYSEEQIFELIENDEINAAEEGFMCGYMNA